MTWSFCDLSFRLSLVGSEMCIRDRFVVLVAAAGGAVAEIVKAIRPARKIAVYRTGDVVRVEVEGAGRGDIPAAVKAAKGRDTEDAE